MDLRAIAVAAYGGTEPKRMKASVTADIGIKRCTVCREWQPVTAFASSKNRGDGLDHKCRPCARKYLEDWHSKSANAGKRAEYTRKSRYATEEAKARTRANRVRDRCRAYGITVERYEELKEQQGNRCAMCGKTAAENGKALAVDHDHRCCPEPMRSCGSCVRGLLCSPCNVAVGYFESEETMAACRAYVERKGSNPVGHG